MPGWWNHWPLRKKGIQISCLEIHPSLSRTCPKALRWLKGKAFLRWFDSIPRFWTCCRYGMFSKQIRSNNSFLIQVWEGQGVVKGGRTLIGATNPADSTPGTIRGDFAIQVGRNIIHGSDTVENANKEIALWFKTEELANWTPADQTWVYEKL